jgi:hypothetical protein
MDNITFYEYDSADIKDTEGNVYEKPKGGASPGGRLTQISILLEDNRL